MSTIIGIDLGTTTSEIAYLVDGKPTIINNKESKSITPSVVALNRDDNIVIGATAKRTLEIGSEHVIQEIKRKMGSEETVWLGGKEYKPQQISAMILKYLKECAEDYLGETVTEAVITVPAMFDNLQRQATKDAAAIAGLKVDRIINEPTAAALAYGLDNLGASEKVLVYDLGGGTFDVTILEMYEGILDVKVSRGNNSLGGKDFDERIMELVFHDIQKKSGLDLRKNRAAVGVIKAAAENAKIDLSANETAEINIPFIPSYFNSNGSPIPVDLKITRTQFDLLIKDLVQSTDTIVDEALQACGLAAAEINSVIVAGGSTRIPCIRRLLKNKFGDKIRYGINPDEVVALGAAVQAGIKAGLFGEENEILITDVCQYSLGTSVLGEDYMGMNRLLLDVLIKKDTTIPYTNKRTYYTTKDNQTKMKIDAYQGDNQLVENNILIGDFMLEGIPENTAQEEGVEVSFSYDINGILKVTATIISTGKTKTEVFNLKSMSSEQIEIAKADLNVSWRNSTLIPKVKGLMDTTEMLMGSMKQGDKVKVEAVMSKMKQALQREDLRALEQLESELAELLFDMK